MSETVAAFLDECADLDDIVAELADAEWARDTPAKGWTIAHQIAHLAWTDEVAIAAAERPQDFAAVVAQAGQDPLGFVDVCAEEGAKAPPAEILARWRSGRTELAQVLTELAPGTTLPWFGPPMSPRSMATARLMETWAHGYDVATAAGVQRVATDRLRDICHLGVRTRDFAYLIRGKEAPGQPFRVELTAPSGEIWTWGEPGAEVDQVSGTAEEFCLVVTQRRPVAETSLRASGEAAAWLTIAQAFAGAPR